MNPSRIQLDPNSVKLQRDPELKIWCQVRKKWMFYTPEEAVRQSTLHYLIDKQGYSPSLMAVEKQLKVQNEKKRFDILVYDHNAAPHILVECKSPYIKITDAVTQQLLGYNLYLKSKYLMMTNGLESYVYDAITQEWIDEIPKTE